MKANFEKSSDKLLPAIVQDHETKNVLMLGFFNKEALAETIKTKKVTFFSRSKGRLWTKGEESGNFLELIDIKIDCDQDTFLVLVKPAGPVCHKGTDTCWGDKNKPNYGFISELEEIISDRKENFSSESYISGLFKKGTNKIAQKVGEEAVEVVIASKDEDQNEFLNESADLLFHFLILLKERNSGLSEVEDILKKRHK